MSDLHIDAWDAARMDELVGARAEFEARPDFSELVSQASERGYRRLSIYEQMEKRIDAYSWRGGVWVKYCLSSSRSEK